jgi:hypothetical protein
MLYRWLARVLATAAVLLLVSCLALWVISYFRGEYFKRTSWSLSATTDQWSIMHINYGSGIVELTKVDEMQPAFIGNFTASDAPFSNNRTIPSGVEWDNWVLPSPGPRQATEMRLGVATWSSRGRWTVQVALWLPTLVSLSLCSAAMLILRHANRPIRRFRQGLCPTCGYDIRATPSQCPECGTSLPAAKWKRPAIAGDFPAVK